MLCILKLVWLCDRLFGFRVDSCCLWVRLVIGLVWLMNSIIMIWCVEVCLMFVVVILVIIDVLVGGL